MFDHGTIIIYGCKYLTFIKPISSFVYCCNWYSFECIILFFSLHILPLISLKAVWGAVPLMLKAAVSVYALSSVFAASVFLACPSVPYGSMALMF